MASILLGGITTIKDLLEILPKIKVPQKCARSQFGKLASREYVTQTITIDSTRSA